MGKLLEGKVALITGAGRGIGRDHAIMMAEHGARVVVNDLGGDEFGGPGSLTPAQEVVSEIEAMGGEAVVNGGNVASFDDAKAMIDQAIDTYGDINIVVNNAGILRDRMVFSMSEDDWDAVIAVHLKGTFGPSHHAAVHWRAQVKAGGRGIWAHHQYCFAVRHLRQCRPVQLRCSESWYRSLFDHYRAGTRQVWRHGELSGPHRCLPTHSAVDGWRGKPLRVGYGSHVTSLDRGAHHLVGQPRGQQGHRPGF